MLKTTTEPLRSLIYEPGSPPRLRVLDQLLLPAQQTYVDISNVQAAWQAIRDMTIRGAPLIAIVAVLGLAVDLHTNSMELNTVDENDATQLLAFVQAKLDYLVTSRPTAVNLSNAMVELKDICQRAVTTSDSTTTTTARERLLQAVTNHAEFMLERDLHDNQTLAQHGANELLSKYAPQQKLTVLTICNTGSLATALYGTALGIVRALRDMDRLHAIVALETRPYNQGSRLTAFEMQAERMPGATLITDSMAAFYCQRHAVHGIVVGADRVCANGDTANKIGTYQLALIAQAHDIPFYVAAPFTTLDIHTATGDDCVIEERPAHEFLQSSQAPVDMNVWNPAFDITPARLITGIVTEKGVLHPANDGTFDVRSFVESGISTPSAIQQEYTEQTVHSLPTYLMQQAPDAMKILETTDAHDLKCTEVGDGNLNLVFIVTNQHKLQNQVIVKQSLPYVRCVGESWPLTLDRAFYEYRALVAQKAACPEFVPTLYHFSKPNGLMVMEYFKPPHIILRKGLIQGIRYPTMALDMGMFCAKTLFMTSGFALSTTELRSKVELWSANSEMCALTEQVVFTEPYMEAANNRWTSPQLDDEKAAIEQDVELKHAAAHYKHKFVGSTQALIHADLHSGSVMCAPSPHATFVIDPEFAFYGPMGFDTGAFVGNLFLAYVSQPGHHATRDSDYAEWILEQIAVFYTTFEQQFVELWNDPTAHVGFVYGRSTLDSHEAIQLAQASFLKDLLADTLGFAGMKMLRRIVGIAHVEDLESIADADLRSQCEKHGLALAKTFIKTAPVIPSIEAAIQLARDLVSKS